LSAVFFYISGHGFGHASRQIEIINSLGAARPDLAIVVRTSAPRWLFDRTARVPLTLVTGDTDTGVVQIDSLHLDERATIQRAGQFYRTLPERAQEEAALLRARDARLVVADAPPLGCASAAAAGIPSVAVTNFTWDWIYEGYAGDLLSAPELLPAIRSAYRQAEAAWRLPMHGGFAPFSTIDDVPFVARHAGHDRDIVRRTLRLPMDRPLVLASFGGYGVNSLDTSRLDCLDTYGVVITCRDRADVPKNTPAGLSHVSEDELYGSGLRYEDLVAACDVVATKPGYGIIAECVANDTAILYTSRGRFREYDVLVAEMPRHLRCGFIDHAALFSGAWRAPLDRVMSLPAPVARPATNGADVVAEKIARLLAP
jgi:L-arabinokinase